MQRFLTALTLLIIVMASGVSFAHEKEKVNAKENAILIVSFGTSMPEARKAIDNLYNAAVKEFPEYDVQLAFTSNIIRRKIAREQNLNVLNPVQALADFNDKGFKNVYVMPTHIIPGEEYDEIKNVVDAFKLLKGKYGFEKLVLAKPFLNNYDDCKDMAEILIKRFDKYLQNSPDTAIILMGHGTPEHIANALYSLLQFELNKRMPGKFFIGTVEAAPMIDDVVASLKNNPEIKNLVISPFMIVAGDHANNDLAGTDDEESWLNILKSNGYENITPYLSGLGEDENITANFITRLKKIVEK